MYDLHDYDQIPAHTMDALNRYVNDGLPPGGFLTAVLENDLRGAVQRADDTNLPVIPIIVGYLYNRVPSHCWGGPGTVEEYCEKVRDTRAHGP